MLLYLHIPFCDSLCHYCAFNSYTNLHHLQKSYMNAIISQLKDELINYNVTKNSIETLFIGGGTPSCVSSKFYEPFFNILNPYMIENAEITTEANPNSATKKWLKGMFDLGVNRVSFGVQSFDEEKLKFLNRSHSKNQAITAIKDAKSVGFKHISLDLIYGTIKDNLDLLENDLDIAFSLPIDHLSAYSLTIEAKTKFYTTPSVSVDDEELAHYFIDSIKKRGFTQYEISNFGTYKSKHNIGYWEYKDYIGIGSGAVGFLKDERYYTQNEPEKYIQNPSKIEVEKLSNDDIKTEKILLGLRSDVGFEKDILNQKELENVKTLLKEDKLTHKKDRFYNSDFFLSDEIALFITS